MSRLVPACFLGCQSTRSLLSGTFLRICDQKMSSLMGTHMLSMAHEANYPLPSFWDSNRSHPAPT